MCEDSSLNSKDQEENMALSSSGASLGFSQDGCPIFLGRWLGVKFKAPFLENLVWNIYPIFHIVYLLKMVYLSLITYLVLEFFYCLVI